MTKNHRYSLSEGSKHILTNLDEDVLINFVYTESEKRLPTSTKQLAKRIEELLKTLSEESDGRLVIRKIDPSRERELKWAATVLGVEEQVPHRDNNEPFFLGLSLHVGTKTDLISTVTPEDEGNLEYQIMSKIKRLTRIKIPKVGLIAGVNVVGSNAFSYEQDKVNKNAWEYAKALDKDYDLKVLNYDTKVIPLDIDLLVVIHPESMKRQTLYAIDQYILEGGSLLLYVDPASMTAMRDNSVASFGEQQIRKSDFYLLKSWGIDYDASKTLVDPENAMAVDARHKKDPTGIELGVKSLQQESPVTKNLQKIVMPFGGALAIGDVPKGVNIQVLAESSLSSKLVPTTEVFDPHKRQLSMSKIPAKSYPMIIHLSGNFLSAFSHDDPEVTDNYIKESQQRANIIVVADSDLLEDSIWSQRSLDRITYKTIRQKRFDNLILGQNAVNYLLGGKELISIRNKVLSVPTFTKVEQLRNQSQEQLRVEFASLQKRIEVTSERLRELYKAKGTSGQGFVISPEALAEREKLKSALDEMYIEKERLDKNLNYSVDQLGQKLLWLNVGLAPLLILLFGFTVWQLRKLK
ncbi:MAG: GldG family protein [Lentisphaeria bacterium]|nr:GldG family protein [Lentisphaeria bacterium]